MQPPTGVLGGLDRPIMSGPNLFPLYKQQSWLSDTDRDEAWLRRKMDCTTNRRRSKSLTDLDLDELKACIELGFGFSFDSPVKDRTRLSNTIPGLDLFYTVTKHYHDSFSVSDSSFSHAVSPHTIFTPGENPQLVKTKLRQWAQVVACSVRQCC